MTDHKLPCAVVRDLLPSYVEGLTEPETTQAVEAHLDTCPDCRKRCDAMKAPEALPKTETKEVDYLKTVRKKNHLKIIGAVVGVLLAGILGIALKLFVIGSPVNPDTVALSTSPVENGLEIGITSVTSANAFTGWKINEDEDAITITARSVLVSPWNQDGSTSIVIPLRPAVREVRFFDRVIWKDGLSVSHYANRIFQAKTPYVGDAPAVNRLLSAMDMDAHTLELQTKLEPYGLTVHLNHPLELSREYIMEGSAYLLLALVDNLGVVTICDPEDYSFTLTREKADLNISDLFVAHGEQVSSIKYYGKSPYTVQQLLCLTGLD